MSRGRLKLDLDVKARHCDCSARTRLRRDRRQRRLMLKFLRQIARLRALRDRRRLCTVDDVYKAVRRRGHPPEMFQAAAPFIFRTPDWRVTRVRLKSRQPSARGREIKAFQLVGDAARLKGPPFTRADAILIEDYRELDSLPAKFLPAEAVTAPPPRKRRRCRCREKARS